MTKGILIDPKSQTFTEVEINDWKDIAPKIEADLFDVVSIDDKNDLYVDDEGLLNIDSETKFIHFKGETQPLAGMGLVLGVNEDGDSVDATITIDQLKEMVEFFDMEQTYRFAKEHGL